MTLAEEAQLYLAVVETFRAEGYEPHWRRETPLERAELGKYGTPRHEDGVKANLVVSRGRKR